MPSPDEVFNRENTEAVCQKLLAGGWITHFSFHDATGQYAIKWTPKGLKKARLLNQIAEELIVSPQQFCGLAVICYMNAPHD